jgi:hypothetical protein
MNASQPDIQPDDLQFILTTLRREFPTSAVDYIPKPDNIGLLAAPLAAEGQQRPSVARVAFLEGGNLESDLWQA